MAFSRVLHAFRGKDLPTLANAALGFLAIYAAHLGAYWAGLFVLAAIAADGLDGWLARRSKGGATAFGRELDSLADLVSFGAAPAFLVVANRGDLAGVLAALAFLCAACIRLAHFNLQKTGRAYTGLPSPVAALVVLAGLYVFGDAFLAPLAAAALMLADFTLEKPW